MTAHPLDGARAKLARAAEHLDVFERDVLSYIGTSPVQIDQRDDPEGELRRIRWIASASRDPPETLGLVVGDWANNTRAALDYIVFEIVRKETGNADPRWTQFPITTAEADYPRRAAQQLRDASPWALPVFDGLQPFHDGADAAFHPLAVLMDISNKDKHRLVHTTAMQFAGSQARLSGTSLLQIRELTQNPGTVTGERVILDALIKTNGNDFAIELNVQVTVALERFEFPAVDLLYGITDEVAAIVEWFSPALD
jgi:hypothetical protein